MEITSRRVKLGIIAPKETTILRGEMPLVRDENRGAVGWLHPDGVRRFIDRFRSAVPQTGTMPKVRLEGADKVSEGTLGYPTDRENLGPA
jgi:hypothetical protein